MKLPNGLKLIPIEPTEEMIEAAFEVIRSESSNEREFRIKIFQAMSNAAPKEHGAWNSPTGGTRKELEIESNKLRKMVKKQAKIWNRYANLWWNK